MQMTPRERVRAALRFQSPDRIPRDLWTLPWAERQFPDELAEIRRRFPPDIVTAPSPMLRSPRVSGDWYTPGTYIDEWGCRFHNIQAGAIGEVRDPLLTEIARWREVTPPYETFPADRRKAVEEVNGFCRNDRRIRPCRGVSPTVGAVSVHPRVNECHDGHRDDGGGGLRAA